MTMYFKPLYEPKVHLAANCVVTFITYSTVALRIYSRLASSAGIGWDDIFVVISLPLATGMLIVQGLKQCLTLGVGYSTVETLPNLPTLLKLTIAYELVFAMATMMVKFSALCFYLRVFVNQGLQRAAKLVFVFVLLWSTANVLQVFLICRPFSGIWNLTAPATCGNQIASFISIGVFNVVTDLVILALPIKTVWNLKARVGLKIALTAIFGIGLVVTAVSIARIVALVSLDLTRLTETMLYGLTLSTTEPMVGIFCISLPMLRPVFRCRCLERLRSTTGSSNGRYNQKRYYRYYNSNDNAGGGSTQGTKNSKNNSHVRSQKSHNRSANETLHEDDKPVPLYEYPTPLGKRDSGLNKTNNAIYSVTNRPVSPSGSSEVELAPAGATTPPGIRIDREWAISHV